MNLLLKYRIIGNSGGMEQRIHSCIKFSIGEGGRCFEILLSDFKVLLGFNEVSKGHIQPISN